MSKAAFPINDLLRRKLQTTLTIAILTLSIASTLFLLLFSSRLGVGITSATGTLTVGLTAIFSQFLLFMGILIFAVGAVLTSFIAFLMMAQRTRDFGLIKAAGCPNNLVAGYFTTELLTTILAGSVLGIIIGFLLDYVTANIIFGTYMLPNFWFAPLVFIVFFVLSLIFGVQPILKASRMSPVKALSPITYYGLTTENKRKPLSKYGITWRISSRSLYRRQSATIRIVILLSIVFVLLTVSVAGGIIASGTTSTWIQKPENKNTIAIATNGMGNQYELLLSKFSGAKQTGDFNYSDPNFSIPGAVVAQLNALPNVSMVDTRLVLNEQVQEVGNFSFDTQSSQTTFVGDSRQGNSMVIGVNPENLSGTWNVNGRFLSANSDFEAVIGDSISQTMYLPDQSKGITNANPLVEGITLQNKTFNIVGVCVDPINNGYVTYVPIDRLENITSISSPNLLLVTLKNPTDKSATIMQIKTMLQTVDPNLNVFSLDTVVDKNTNFLASTWQTIMFLPLFTLASAAFCLVSYMMLTADEQHQEFAVLRAIGAKPKFIVLIIAIQSIIVLLSSLGVGISFGTIITLLILIPQPIVTIFTILEISGWLFAALLSMFLLSLYPAFRLARTSILKIMT